MGYCWIIRRKLVIRNFYYFISNFCTRKVWLFIRTSKYNSCKNKFFYDIFESFIIFFYFCKNIMILWFFNMFLWNPFYEEKKNELIENLYHIFKIVWRCVTKMKNVYDIFNRWNFYLKFCFTFISLVKIVEKIFILNLLRTTNQ